MRHWYRHDETFYFQKHYIEADNTQVIVCSGFHVIKMFWEIWLPLLLLIICKLSSLIRQIHPHITTALSFSINLSIAGRWSIMKNGDRQTTFISSVSRWCLKWLSCLSLSSTSSHNVCTPFHYLSIKMSNFAVWSVACLSSPHLLHHFHFYFLCWNVAIFLTHGKPMPNLTLSILFTFCLKGIAAAYLLALLTLDRFVNN